MIRLQTILAIALFCLVISPCPLGAQSDFEVQFVKDAQRMDEAYYAAGTRVDLVAYNLDEAKRQGRKVPSDIRSKVDAADSSLRARYLVLENERKAISAALRLTSTKTAKHILKVENLGGGGSGESGWFGLCSATFKLSSGQSVVIAARDFENGAYIDLYSYQCEPSPIALVHGKQATTHTMIAAFDLPADSEGDAQLTVSGLDHDKPGQTPIRISVNGVSVFEGDNGFRKDGWSDKTYPVPAAAWKSDAGKRTTTESLQDRAKAWVSSIDEFAKWSKTVADDTQTIATGIIKGLVWHKRSYASDWWQHNFVRGMCFDCDSTLFEEQWGRPWFADNQEYVAKAFDSIGVNMVYFYPYTPQQYAVFAAENDKIGTPVVMCRWETAHLSYWNRTYPNKSGLQYYLDTDGVANEAIEAVRSLDKGSKTLRGIAIDEPRLDEDETEMVTNPKVLGAFRQYLESRRKLFDTAGVSIDNQAPPVSEVKSEKDRAPWMEWQYFKMHFMTDHYKGLSDRLTDKGYMLFPIIQDYLTDDPQTAPYSYWGEKLPIISTDLYNNASVNEAYGMDLLHSVARGRSVLTIGAGYSARNPDRFYRSLANAMLRADGVMQWNYVYAAKYRARYFFVRPGVKDDRGRDSLENWSPEYWDLQKRAFVESKNADKYLGNVKSASDIAVLYSMRSAIAESAQGGLWANTSYRNSLYTYSALLNSHKSIDGCMVEALTKDKLKQYKVLFLIDAPALDDNQCELLRKWVKNGGTLVVGGRTSIQDQWGRTRPDYALADIFGLRFASVKDSESQFTFGRGGSDIVVKYEAKHGYASVTPVTASVLEKWGNGDPAMLMNTAGKGRVFFFSALRPGYFAMFADEENGLYAEPKGSFPDVFRFLAGKYSSKPAVEIIGSPEGLETALRKKGNTYILHLLDWRDGRQITGLKLRVNAPGRWAVSYPCDGNRAGTCSKGSTISLRPTRVHEMVVITPVQP